MVDACFFGDGCCLGNGCCFGNGSCLGEGPCLGNVSCFDDGCRLDNISLDEGCCFGQIVVVVMLLLLALESNLFWKNRKTYKNVAYFSNKVNIIETQTFKYRIS